MFGPCPALGRPGNDRSNPYWCRGRATLLTGRHICLLKTELELQSSRPRRKGRGKPSVMVQRRVIPIDKHWVFKQAGKETSEFRSVAQFPTNVHLDLIHHGIIPDPFVGKNEEEVQWVGEKAWVYRTTFSSPEVHGSTVVLAFHGLDTYATVVLNGKQILKTGDMFVPERVVVTELLRGDDDNELEITFESAYLIGKKIVEQYPDHGWGCWNGDPSRLAVRKAQYHYVSSREHEKRCSSSRIPLTVVVSSGVGLGPGSDDVRALEAYRAGVFYFTDC